MTDVLSEIGDTSGEAGRDEGAELEETLSMKPFDLDVDGSLPFWMLDFFTRRDVMAMAYDGTLRCFVPLATASGKLPEAEESRRLFSECLERITNGLALVLSDAEMARRFGEAARGRDDVWRFAVDRERRLLSGGFLPPAGGGADEDGPA